MNIHQVEVVVHVDNTLNEQQRGGLISHIMERDGVETAHFTPGREHLIVVDYDRDKLHAQDVLGYIQEENTTAELVGPI